MGLTLYLRTGRYAVSRLEGAGECGTGWPEWALGAGGFVSLTRRGEEVSLVTLEEAVPEGVQSQGGWRLLELEGPFDFGLTGILLSVAAPLAEAGVGIFAVSTFDTDVVMVQESQLERALAALRGSGHQSVEG